MSLNSITHGFLKSDKNDQQNSSQTNEDNVNNARRETSRK